MLNSQEFAVTGETFGLEIQIYYAIYILSSHHSSGDLQLVNCIEYPATSLFPSWQQWSKDGRPAYHPGDVPGRLHIL